jgi:probable phosphoglycerate mutase
MELAILARHGEADHNRVRRVNGNPRQPIHLTERGRQEAGRLGAELADRVIDLCVVTEFPRTRETADVALAGRDVPRLQVPELNDPTFGDLEGHPIEEVRAFVDQHGALAEFPGGGESRVAVIRRYCAGFSEVVHRQERVVLVVAHGLPVSAVQLAASGKPVPLSLHGIAEAHAEPRSMTRDELLAGIEGMRRWAAEQAG